MSDRKLTIIAAVVFLVIGIIAGLVIAAHTKSAHGQMLENLRLPGLFVSAFPGAGIRADSIVAVDDGDAYTIPPAALAETPAVGRYLRTSSSDATETEWGALPALSIPDGGVTTAKLATGAVTPPKLAAGAVTSPAIADRNVTSIKIAVDAITGRELGANVVASGHLVQSPIINETRLFPNSVTGEKIPADTINNGHLLDNAVNTAELVNGSVTETKLSTAVQTKLNATASGGTDQTARDAAAAAQATANTNTGNIATNTSAIASLSTDVTTNTGQINVAQRDANNAGTAATAAATAAAAAQLEADTVILAGPEFVHNDRTARNINIHIRHPIGAYRTARVISVSPGFQGAVLDEYDHTVPDQWINAEISALSLGNIWDATVEIDDGQGGTRSVQRWAVGSFIPVEIRLLTGRGGDTVFIRQVDVLVIAPPVEPKPPRIIQAAVNSTNTAGVTSITLPTDYATYRGLEMVAWTATGNGLALPIEVGVAYLAAQTANRNMVVKGTPGARNDVVMTWSPTARTLTLAGGARIHYAELHD